MSMMILSDITKKLSKDNRGLNNLNVNYGQGQMALLSVIFYVIIYPLTIKTFKNVI